MRLTKSKFQSRHRQRNNTSVTSLKDGRYSASYRPTTPEGFIVAITIAGTSIMGSPFTLNVWKRSKNEKGITAESASASRMEGIELVHGFY